MFNFLNSTNFKLNRTTIYNEKKFSVVNISLKYPSIVDKYYKTYNVYDMYELV